MEVTGRASELHADEDCTGRTFQRKPPVPQRRASMGGGAKAQCGSHTIPTTEHNPSLGVEMWVCNPGSPFTSSPAQGFAKVKRNHIGVTCIVPGTYQAFRNLLFCFINKIQVNLERMNRNLNF